MTTDRLAGRGAAAAHFDGQGALIERMPEPRKMTVEEIGRGSGQAHMHSSNILTQEQLKERAMEGTLDPGLLVVVQRYRNLAVGKVGWWLRFYDGSTLHGSLTFSSSEKLYDFLSELPAKQAASLAFRIDELTSGEWRAECERIAKERGVFDAKIGAHGPILGIE